VIKKTRIQMNKNKTIATIAPLKCSSKSESQ
jgi:hypothetical protein